MKQDHPLVGMIRRCVFLHFNNEDIIFCWVSNHVGINGRPDEKADCCQVCSGLTWVEVGVPRFK